MTYITAIHGPSFVAYNNLITGKSYNQVIAAL